MSPLNVMPKRVASVLKCALAVVFVVPEQQENAAVLHPGGDHGTIDGLNVVGLAIHGIRRQAGVGDHVDGEFVEIVGGRVVEFRQRGPGAFPDVAEFGIAGVGGVIPVIVEAGAVLFLVVEGVQADDFSPAQREIRGGGGLRLRGAGIGQQEGSRRDECCEKKVPRDSDHSFTTKIAWTITVLVWLSTGRTYGAPAGGSDHSIGHGGIVQQEQAVGAHGAGFLA